METTYFWKAMNEPATGTRYVSISRSKARGAESMPEYPALFPSWDIIKHAHTMGYNEASYYAYRDAYFAQLDKLDPVKIYNDLKDCTLVCFESTRDLANGVKFCHRRMVAGWLNEKLGITVPEETRHNNAIAIAVPAIYRNTPYNEA